MRGRLRAQSGATNRRSSEKEMEGDRVRTPYQRPRSRSSCFRGVTFYKRTKRWEAHIWDMNKQIYLGASFIAHQAARAYDRAAIRFRGIHAELNFRASDYEDEFDQLMALSKDDLVKLLRKQSSGRGSPLPAYPTMTQNENLEQRPDEQRNAQVLHEERTTAERGEDQREDPPQRDSNNHAQEDFQIRYRWISEYTLSTHELLIRRNCRVIMSSLYGIPLPPCSPVLEGNRPTTASEMVTQNLFSPRASTIKKEARRYRSLVAHILQG